MVKDLSDSERGNTACTVVFNYQLEFCYMHHHTDRIAHTTAFVAPVVEQWLE